MARDLEHLQLPTWEHALPRRRRKGGHQPKRDAATHGRALIAEAEQEVNRLVGRKQEYPQGINPKFVFKLLLNPSGDLDEQALGQMGLRLLAREPKKAIVVFPNDATLLEFRRRLEEYAGIGPKGQKYGNLAAIEAIGELEPSDRIGRRLRIQPIAPDEKSLFDIELWYAGPDQARQQVRELEDFVRLRGLRVTDRWIGRYLCLMRAQLDFPTLQEILSIDYVKEIERRPQPSFEILPILRARAQDYEPPGDIPTDLAGVLIIDSGVMQGHPLLGPALGDAQVFPDSLRNRIKGGAEDGDERTGGHGTAVAGIAIYNDVGECIGKKSFIPSALLFSARITDDKNEYR